MARSSPALPRANAASTGARGRRRLLGRTSSRSLPRRSAPLRRSPAATSRPSCTAVVQLRSTTPTASASRTSMGRSTRSCGVAASAPRSASPLPALSLRVCLLAPRLAWWLRSSRPLGAAAPSGQCRTCSGVPFPPCAPHRVAEASTVSTALTPGRPLAATSASRGFSAMGALHRASPRGRASRWMHGGCTTAGVHRVCGVCFRGFACAARSRRLHPHRASWALI